MARFGSPQEALRAGVDIAGGQSAFGRMVGCSQSAIYLLLKKGKALPGKYVLKAEAGTGISRHDYNAEFYPRDEAAEAPGDPATRFEAAR